MKMNMDTSGDRLREPWELSLAEAKEADARKARIEKEVAEMKKKRDERIVKGYRLSDTFPRLGRFFSHQRIAKFFWFFF